ncbi:MAG TPA: glycoside hydrolase family 127 protein [Solibacterales bacterium]|nr:glycoside hydrolase family 127 protein [Bryobacterales bacterium]
MTRVLIPLALFAAPLLAQSAALDRPILDTSRSPKALLRGVPVRAVQLEGGYWAARQKANEEVSLPSLLALFEEKGIMDNFRRVSGRKDVARRGPLYTDSDVYKWLEAVGFLLQYKDAPELRKQAEAVIDDIAAAQEPSGYLKTFYTKENLAQRHKNMRHGHELYCLGHLIQGGIAWERATGDRKLLSVGTKMVDYLMANFGPDKQPIFEGHPEIELALVELYRHTGERKYLQAAGYILEGDERNLKNVPPRELVYLFTVKPFSARTKMEGHAVRAGYAAAGAADYYLETGDERYRKVLDTLWDDMTRRKQYLTGGVGSRASGEAYGEPYELPNQQAYTESCAAISTMFWNWRILHADPHSKYMDNFERALYNGANSGLSLKGDLYCYRNPLEHVGNPEDRIRNPWYDTTCCPPNLQRVLASLGGYFYSTSKDGLWVHLYDNNRLNWKLEDGTKLALTQATKYPWEGQVEITVSPETAKEFTLFLRRPEWSKGTVTVAGAPFAAQAQNGYLALRRTWKPGDKVVLKLDVAPRLTASNPYVRENMGRVAVERGPLLYCMEGLDQAQGTTVFDWTLDLGPTGQPAFQTSWEAERLGGVTVLKHKATRSGTPVTEGSLYRTLDSLRRQPAVAGSVTLIPYYTFHNRDVTSMQVWIPYRQP